MRACGRCGARIAERCPICDWRVASTGEQERIAPQRRRAVLWVTTAATAGFAALFAAAVAMYLGT